MSSTRRAERGTTERGGRAGLFARLCLWGGLLCGLAGATVWILGAKGAHNSSGRRAEAFTLAAVGQSGSWLQRLRAAGDFKPLRKAQVLDTFGTIFHGELSSHYSNLRDAEAVTKLVTMLRRMEETGIKTAMYSISWEYFAPNETALRLDYIDTLMETTCANTGVKAALIVDMMRAPAWLFAKHPSAKAVDAGGRTYNHLSWFHPEGNRLALVMLRTVAERLATKFKGCALSMQPVYNNEYEAKYTQEYDLFQDYSPSALAAFRQWLQSMRPLAHLNQRWSTAFKSWPEVEPPRLQAGVLMGVEDGARYWDFLRFREELGAETFNRACGIVKAAGLQCYHRFPEFFSVLDAMYGANMFKRIAASPNTDYIIMDSNFRTPYGTIMNLNELRLYVSAAAPYGKPVYFEAAVERYADMALLQAGFRNAMLAGAANLGITNWHTRIEMNSTLREAMYGAPAACTATELVGVFIHLDSCGAWQGLQLQWKRKDPLHDFIEELAERLSEECGTDIAVYIELDRFLADMPTFTRAVFVEPLVLYGNAELESYVAAKAALKGLPHEVLRLPTNSSRGLGLKVLQDL